MTGLGGQQASIAVQLPFHADALLAYLGKRAMRGVEEVRGRQYRRVVSWRGQIGVATIDLDGTTNSGRAPVSCGIPGAGRWAREMFDRLIDASTDVRPIEGHLLQDPWLRAIVSAQPGVRIPGALSAFELAVRAVLGQQISVAGATRLAAQIAARYGQCMDPPSGSLTTTFPAPGVLVEADIEQVGIPHRRAAAIRRLAEDVSSGRLELERGKSLDETYQQLLSIPGIGPWTATYVALRALGDGDAIGTSDLGLRQALGTAHTPATPAAVEQAALSWRPYRGYATLHIWTKLLLGGG
jgi:AraC family transcriptional regulator of adaptative response / DNA-3-methyladenine glycosylase II